MLGYVFKNQLKRLCIFLIPSAEKRTQIIKKSGFFSEFGDDVFFQPRKLPADPKFIKLHNNIQIASDVTFITHDVMHRVFQKMNPEAKYYSHLGCIEVMDNVFIGSGTTILPNVRIGPNAVVAACSVVTKDVPSGTVVGGAPAKVIGSFSDLMEKRTKESGQITTTSREARIQPEWAKFYLQREDKKDS